MFALYYLRITIFQIGALSTNVAFYLLIMTYRWFGNHITAETVYYINDCFQILSYTLGVQLPNSIIFVAEVVASVRRLMHFLSLPETQTPPQGTSSIHAKVTLNHVDVGFDKKVLENVNFAVSTGITFIAGPIASGKSTLLKLILQEYQPSTGTVLTQGTISYASQDPWLFPSSIKQNILFGQEYDVLRYQKVLKVCALEYDLNLLPDKDGTIVEDHGINLSKGQQARINLARAVYKNADIYLLDDCLSALDNQVGDFIFEECIRKFLQSKIVIFVSHNSRYLKKVDQVLMVESGKVKPMKLLEVLGKYEETNDVTEDLHLDNRISRRNLQERKVYHEFNKTGKVNLNYIAL